MDGPKWMCTFCANHRLGCEASRCSYTRSNDEPLYQLQARSAKRVKTYCEKCAAARLYLLWKGMMNGTIERLKG